MSDITTIVGAALDDLRQQENLTEEQLARRLGVETSTLWRWRNGRHLSKSTRILIPLVANITKMSPEKAA